MYFSSQRIDITTESLAKVYHEHRVGKEQFESFLKQFETQIKKCDKCETLIKQKLNLIAENEILKQRLIDAGLEKPAIRNDASRNA